MKTLIALIAALAAILIASQRKDIARYIRIRQM
jgi:hypothetical protein